MPSSNSMPPGTDTGRPPGNFTVIQPEHSVDRSQTASVEDYSRIMLEYTQRRMAGFADPEDTGYAASRSSRSSNTSGQSGRSTSGILAGHAPGPSPPSKAPDSSPDSAGAQSAV
ncbi:hypothetical protein ASPVEDRAFT_47168 [Aspergillus versicolor CBS 583.65]|uniref:Uncharacterized protein n=1 Tax=Aspergillus versicolor CBS 583.65 TaxID=1036611 RepID=A0A1L9Q2P8_ASPVE|nr:uncharacterized protein ASPVEDRAFT_47168 [Aspergillus versicolor CBS 583.65]OJJ07982.1 hypothetical protein ASPVEDRAFT_47168 [Aspergillus versicolor CBS 583.65]